MKCRGRCPRHESHVGQRRRPHPLEKAGAHHERRGGRGHDSRQGRSPLTGDRNTPARGSASAESSPTRRTPAHGHEHTKRARHDHRGPTTRRGRRGRVCRPATRLPQLSPVRRRCCRRAGSRARCCLGRNARKLLSRRLIFWLCLGLRANLRGSGLLKRTVFVG